MKCLIQPAPFTLSHKVIRRHVTALREIFALLTCTAEFCGSLNFFLCFYFFLTLREFPAWFLYKGPSEGINKSQSHKDDCFRQP